MAKQKQEVWAEVKFTDGTTVSGPIEGTNDGNLQSKLSAWFRLKTIQHNFDQGAVLTVRIAPAEADEFANPER